MHTKRQLEMVSCHIGMYRYERMPFGLRNSPANFKRALDIIISGIRSKLCLVYLDEVILFFSSYEVHFEHLENFLQLFQEALVSLKLRKCDLYQEKVDDLIHTSMPG